MAVWLRIVLARRSGVDDRLDRRPDPQPPVERAAMDDEATERLLGVGDREQVAAAARLAQDAVVADLAAALGVERGPVEDDLGLAVDRSARRTPSRRGRWRRRGPPRWSSRSRGTSCRRRGPGSCRTARSAPACFESCAFVPTGCVRAARPGPRRSRRGRRRRRTRPRARWSGRSGSRTCRGA